VSESSALLAKEYRLEAQDRPVFLTRLFRSSLKPGSTSQRIDLKDFVYGKD
jgi:hypothetical protein